LPANTDIHIREKVSIEQVKILYESTPYLLLINIVVGFCLAYVYWDIIPHQSIIFCLALLVFMVCLRGGFFLSNKKSFDIDNIKFYRLSLIIGGGFAGVIWGIIGIVFFPADNEIYQLFICTCLF
jgi:di/tricarboxylate transporter